MEATEGVDSEDDGVGVTCEISLCVQKRLVHIEICILRTTDRGHLPGIFSE